MSLRTWWQQKNGPAKSVTGLTTLLILQIGLCFASPGEPAWFDRLFHIRSSPHRFGLALVMAEAYLCIATFILLLIALIVWGSLSCTETEPELTLIAHRATPLDSNDHWHSGDSQ